MSQFVCNPDGSQGAWLELPDPAERVMEGVCWGRIDVLFTPAFWMVQAWLDADRQRYARYKLGHSLQEEVAACLLGGYGIPAEVGLAAYWRLRDRGLLSGRPPSESVLTQQLSEPLEINDRRVRYRFARQRSHYLSVVLRALADEDVPDYRGRDFRNWLLQFPGIGHKTASWITRNWLNSDEVAILDIHVYRAGVIAGFFGKQDSVAAQYLDMEERFLQFARAIDVRSTILDTLIWGQMREAAVVAHRAFGRC